jgi:hypothetical protein
MYSCLFYEREIGEDIAALRDAGRVPPTPTLFYYSWLGICMLLSSYSFRCVLRHNGVKSFHNI